MAVERAGTFRNEAIPPPLLFSAAFPGLIGACTIPFHPSGPRGVRAENVNTVDPPSGQMSIMSRVILPSRESAIVQPPEPSGRRPGPATALLPLA